MILLTAKEYVDSQSIIETGRLLAQRGAIDAIDNEGDYKIALFTSADPANFLKDNVKEELDAVIADAQSRVELQLRRCYKWPLQAGGFQIPTDRVPNEVKRLIKAITRYALHDEDVPERVMDNYADALQQAERIGAGDVDLPLDRTESSSIPYAI